MTLPKDLFVVENPKTMAVGTERAYTIDFSNIGTPDAAGDTKAYEADGTDVSSAVLSGSATLSGNVVTLEKFTPASQQVYRITHQVTIGGQIVYGIVDVAAFSVIPDTTAAISASSYGSLASVAALVPRYASRGQTFDDTTRPTRDSVVDFIDQVSSLLNSVLATNGFTIPITDADVTPMLDMFVNQEVAAMVEGANGSGRFGPTTKRGGRKGRFALVFEDVEDFVEMNAIGIERAGAARPFPVTSGILTRDVDEAGDEIFPIRQRKEFGTRWKNWDD